MKEEWLFLGAMVPVDMETTAALVAEIKRLIDVVGGMALAQHPWQGLTDDEYQEILKQHDGAGLLAFYNLVEAKLKEKNT